MIHEFCGTLTSSGTLSRVPALEWALEALPSIDDRLIYIASAGTFYKASFVWYEMQMPKLRTIKVVLRAYSSSWKKISRLCSTFWKTKSSLTSFMG